MKKTFVIIYLLLCLAAGAAIVTKGKWMVRTTNDAYITTYSYTNTAPARYRTINSISFWFPTAGVYNIQAALIHDGATNILYADPTSSAQSFRQEFIEETIFFVPDDVLVFTADLTTTGVLSFVTSPDVKSR